MDMMCVIRSETMSKVECVHADVSSLPASGDILKKLIELVSIVMAKTQFKFISLQLVVSVRTYQNTIIYLYKSMAIKESPN
ncbi:hypothetical protein T4D_12832 [Trichinella pseudospiralis]|uniref:Uncharacterized protein n=1 Tax=Trichinella pseudospiralis TaxID=6337 RepID=A0A0V1F922_TRIPS|nr:hypothetical protein T4D_12832 [Trichinella pseudospiralis]